MKKAIIHGESGIITDICEEGDEFQIYDGADATMKWMEVPDDTTNEHRMVNGVIYPRIELENQAEAYLVARTIAYGSVGEQLDMIYKDQVNGTTTFKDHVAAVKANVPSPSSAPAFTEDVKKLQVTGRMAWDPYPS